jgi:parallel beta-helix repeat protein
MSTFKKSKLFKKLSKSDKKFDKFCADSSSESDSGSDSECEVTPCDLNKDLLTLKNTINVLNSILNGNTGILNIINSTTIGTAGTVNTINSNLNNVSTAVNEINLKQKAKFLIRASDIGTAGYTITQPGVYELVDDVVFNPTAPFNSVTATFVGGGGTGATGFAVVSGGIIRGIVITAGGSGYTTAPSVTFGGTGTGATAAVTIAGGAVTGVTVTAGGTGFSDTVVAAITIRSSNVNLILGDKRLSQFGVNPDGSVSGTQRPFTVGILIPDVIPTATDQNAIGLESIYIDGDRSIIDGFSMYGIRVFAHTYDIQLSNITVKNCGKLASKAIRPFTSYFPHSYNLVSLYGPSFGVAGISIGESQILGMGSNFFIDIPIGPQNATNIPRISEMVLKSINCLNNFYTGIMMVSTSDITIDDSHFDDTFSDDPGVDGVNGYDAIVPSGAQFFHSDKNYRTVTDRFIPVNLMNMHVRNSTFNDTTMRGDFATTVVGLSLFSCIGAVETASLNVTYNNCQFNGTFNSFIGGVTVGYLSAQSEDGTFIDCHFDNTKGLSEVNGFHRSGNFVTADTTFTKSSRNTYLIRCTANNNQQIGNQLITPLLQAVRLIGYAIFFAKNVTMIDCIASDNIANGPLDSTGALSYVAGFFFPDGQVTPIGTDANEENLVVRGCIAARNQTLQGGRAFGFNLNLAGGVNRVTRSALFEDCEAFGNISNIPLLGSLGTQSVGCGFFIDQNPDNTIDVNRSFPVSLINCKAYRNKGAQSIGTGVTQLFSAGIFLRNALRHAITNCEVLDNIYGILLKNCNRCTIRDNHADNNVDLINPGTIGEGFTDVGATGTPTAPTVSTSLFERNKAFGNGTGTTHNGTNGNYNVVYTFGPVPTLPGSLTTGYPTSVNYVPSHNISIIV